jgi:hypothetical protein
MIDDQTYNAFARALAEQIRQRAKGLDDESARIVNTRPQEHVLAGFLTPRSIVQPRPDAVNGESDIDDLPRDSAFELTSIGLEWLADNDALARLDTLSLSLSLDVYIRCTPTFEEQKKSGSWRREHAAGGADVQKTQSVIAGWRRVEIPEFSVEISIPNLLRNKRERIDVSPFVVLPSDMAQAPDIYSARRAVYLTENDCETETAFTAALTRTRTEPFISFWKAFIDVRLIRVPTEPTSVRLAIRAVNDTPAPAKAQGDYLDANLYAVRLFASVPEGVHRPTIFQELPASFRYDRRMPGVGINSHVEARQSGTILLLTAESVPLTETPRLEAREFKDADPTFAALGSNPIHVLESLARHMEGYDAGQWATKLATLSGIELGDAERSRRDFRLEIDRFKRGMQLLKDPAFPLVLQAFHLMNQAMHRANKNHQRWRLFQIAFIVSLLPELASREYSSLATDRAPSLQTK